MASTEFWAEIRRQAIEGRRTWGSQETEEEAISTVYNGTTGHAQDRTYTVVLVMGLLC